VPFIELPCSPLAPGVSPVRIHYRDAGEGPPVLVLHGGWGYEVYPFDRQIAALASTHRIVIPDRSGYGQSTPMAVMTADFHERAVEETRTVIERLGLDRPVVWGHSDGAIIALRLALAQPDAIAGAIVEATHLYRRKPRSRAFFENLVANPRAVGFSVGTALARDHGARWPDVIERHSRAWRQIADEARSDVDDFYDGRLSEVDVPVLVVHGGRDPRTEPGELEALRRILIGPAEAGLHDVHDAASAFGRTSQFAVLADGGHSPHSEPATADEVTRTARQFIDANED
jgi:3-oxoadipate enol-lactonase